MVGNSNKQFQVKTSAIALSYSYEKSINIADKDIISESWVFAYYVIKT
jgi:hypothetical protein